MAVNQSTLEERLHPAVATEDSVSQAFAAVCCCSARQKCLASTGISAWAAYPTVRRCPAYNFLYRVGCNVKLVGSYGLLRPSWYCHWLRQTAPYAKRRQTAPNSAKQRQTAPNQKWRTLAANGRETLGSIPLEGVIIFWWEWLGGADPLVPEFRECSAA